MKCFSCLNTRTNDMRINIDTLSDLTDRSSVNGKVNSPKPGGGARSFTFKELAAATKNFRDDNMIGKGGFGSVFKGRLYSGQVVAIKQLNPDGHQGNQEFIVEVLMLSVFHHPNLVTLIGYCTSGAQRLLVYEYMPMGSLEDHLYDLEPDQKPLSWSTRMKIAVGAARGIEYLHCKISPSVIYRDLKSANILLDRDFSPKLSDFGLAKVGPVGNRTHVSTRIMGTYGYCAPEYAMSGKLTIKSDIYCFGVVLLELITGRKAIDMSKPSGEQYLVAWARPYLKDPKKFGELVDPVLRGKYSRRCLSYAISIMEMCLNEEANRRPKIGDVVVAFEYISSQTMKRVPNEKLPPPLMAMPAARDLKPAAESRQKPRFTNNTHREKTEQKPRSADIPPSKPAEKSGGVVKKAVPSSGKIVTPNLKMFTLTDLKTATKNFRPESMIGEGGFGQVFKGWVDEKTLAPSRAGVGIPVAVKKSNPDSAQGLHEWQSEVRFLGKFHHPNLVKLLGYCWEENQFLLIYEFLPKGSLENHLFSKGEALTWDTRLKIAIEAAQGLTVLHNSEKSVIYRDFKASNILLDSSFNAKLSDFGLAKHGPINGYSHVTTRVMGTHGYAAPEYMATGHLYVRSDVYGFGVVLLELLTGLRAVDPNRPSAQENLVEWAKPVLSQKKKIKKIMDPRLDQKYPLLAVVKTAGLILRCIEADPKNRPPMDEVLRELEIVRTIRDEAKEERRQRGSSGGSGHNRVNGNGLPQVRRTGRTR
ncbi:unnamed protein product [Cochlearia groenlandica]